MLPHQHTTVAPKHFLQGGGEMGEMIRTHDWSNTTLGGIELWPSSLKTTLGILLHSRFPMLLFWGNDMLCFYNDAFRPSLGASGKHPSALGAPGKMVWEEIWDVINPWLTEVKETGEGIWKEDLLVPFYRNGKIEDIYWTFSYSPAYDDRGYINGVFVTCMEMTGRIEAEASAKRSAESFELSEKRFRNLIEHSPVPMAFFKGQDLVFEIANDAYLPLIGKTRNELIGQKLMDIIPEAESILQPIVENLFASGEPFIAKEFPVVINRHGVPEYCVFDFIYEPYREPDGTINGMIVVAQEITQQVQERKNAEISEQKLRAVVESAPFPIGVYVGKEMRIEIANQTMLETWGKGANVVGKLFSDILPELDNTEIFQQLDDVYTTGKPFHANNQRVDLLMDGEMKPFWFKYSFTPLFDTEGNVYGVMNTAAHVTDLVTAQETAKESNRKKDEFLSIASHELKTPLTGIKLYNQLLEREELPEQSRSFVHRSDALIKKLERLIADLLDVSKINAGHLQYKPEPVELSSLIYEAIELVKNENSTHRILIKQLPEANIYADKVRIEQVIYNLISNAIKYSPNANEVIVNMDVADKNVTVSVIDHGIGIEEKELNHIFDRFYRVDDPVKKFSGLGLGLYISNEIIKAHGGELKVKSEPGKGSEFAFTLSLQ